MSTSHLKTMMKEFLDRRFEGKASKVFEKRIHQIIDGLSEDLSEVERGLNSIRIAIKLLFDDKLSDEVFDELSMMVRGSKRL